MEEYSLRNKGKAEEQEEEEEEEKAEEDDFELTVPFTRPPKLRLALGLVLFDLMLLFSVLRVTAISWLNLWSGGLLCSCERRAERPGLRARICRGRGLCAPWDLCVLGLPGPGSLLCCFVSAWRLYWYR